MRWCLLLLAALLINGQVNSLPAAQKEYQLEEWFNQMSEEFNSEITELEADEEPLIEEPIADGLEKSFAFALFELESQQNEIGQQCYQQGLQELLILKKASLKQILKCSRLKEGVKDIGKMVSKTLSLCGEIGGNVKNLLSGLFKCPASNKLKTAWCVVRYFWTNASNIKSLIPSFKEYGLDIGQLAKEVKEIYQQCANPEQVNVDNRLALLLDQSELCALN
uniref:Putative secreted protein panstrongylus lignarius n=1 Tax=Rhodnius prolixus TaxID=13249 RepID=A0A4P6D856_RHOPR